jgi:hypothetical protein
LLRFAAVALAAAPSPAAEPIVIAFLFGMLHAPRTHYNDLIYFLFDLGLDRECAVVNLYVLLYKVSFTYETVLHSPVARNAMMTRWPTPGHSGIHGQPSKY